MNNNIIKSTTCAYYDTYALTGTSGRVSRRI